MFSGINSPKERVPELRSRTGTHGHNMAGARALMRASGAPGADIVRKPIPSLSKSVMYTRGLFRPYCAR